MAVKVVNMIPNSMSNESTRDSEPNISATFLDPMRIAASAFTPDPMSSGSGPIYVSNDGGDTWVLNVVLPGGNKTGDTTLRFAGLSNVLYAGILRSDTGALNILRTADFTVPALMDVLVSKTNDDQPYVEAATVMAGSGTGSDRVYVGENDFAAAAGRTATVDFSLSAATAPAPAGFVTNTRIETRATSSQDGPPSRPAVHLDGTVYAVFHGWRTATTTDIVVVRDDNWASGATPFTALVDAGDGNAGVRAATGVSRPPFGSLLGTQRIGAQGAIAVDPRDSGIVYIAWADGATAAAQTIHVRSSSDSGGTWSADLRAIAGATNPALAINTHGEVGFLYQRLHNPGTGNRWETHFETLVNASDTILADVPDANGTYLAANPIGDYAGLVAVGKSFYGIFCGNNTPDNANFPNGVTYQRNADFVTHTLTDLASNPVGVSIDPFFFKVTSVEAADDFYVRDWTDSAASGDNGAEPSTHAVFYHTSDVWNRRGTLTGEPFTNDQPANEDAGNGAGNIGDNWAFARIRRNVPAVAGSQNVSAHFLVSKFGTGSNYVDSSSGDPDVTFVDPDPVVTFNAADVGPTITTPVKWHLEPVASTHLCLAVEITGPSDPFVAPSLLGNAPGWPTTDLRVINDNNKAQRNMGLSTTPARGVGASDCYCAIVHNAATFVRDFELRYDAPRDVAAALKGAVIEVIGGKEQEFKAQGTIKIAKMQPGENRWIALRFPAAKGKRGQLFAIDFQEIVQGIVVNGFAMGARLGTTEEVVRDKLERHRSVFTRIAASAGSAAAKGTADAAAQLAKNGADGRAFVKFMRDQFGTVESVVTERIPSRSDPFHILVGLRQVKKLLDGENADAIAVSYSCVLNRIDSHLTMLQLDNGDVADILQNVRWQRDLYRTSTRLAKLECARLLDKRSREFIAGYAARKMGSRNYPAFVEGSFQCFAETARALKRPALEKHIDAMKGRLKELAGLQKAHREFLLDLQGVA